MKSVLDAIERFYPIWVIMAIIIGLIFPGVELLSFLSPILLAVMIGSISLTIKVKDLTDLSLKSVSLVYFLQLLMPVIGFFLATLFQFHGSILVGMVIIGAVTPEFVTPVVTNLSKGNISLSSSVLLIAGFGSIVTIPIFTALLLRDNITLNLTNLMIDLVLILLIPMTLGLFLKTWKSDIISKFDHYYSPIATIMLILLIGIATGANSRFILNNGMIVLTISIVVLLMNIMGYGIGFLTGVFIERKSKIAAVFSIGMRDFAVAIGLILSSELDPSIALPVVLFGIVELLTSALLVKYFNRYG